MYHFTSDAHFFHRRIIQYSNRPFESVEDMNEQMIQRWNKQVKKDDIVYHLGDFAFGKIDKIENILKSLNGRKRFINGNHDAEIIGKGKDRFPIYTDATYNVIFENSKRLLDAGLIESIRDYEEVNVNNQFIVLFHFGGRVWQRSHHGAWQLFGHSHSSLPPFGKSVDVGVDSTWITGKAEYRPFSFYEIKEFMDKQISEKVDHHGD
jgi:calcineurin-like phosphoesterase family protein